MRMKISNSKVLLSLAMSFLVILSLSVFDAMTGQDAYAMGGGGGRNSKNLSKAEALSVPSASEEGSLATSQPTAVPEPGTLILIGVGAVGVGFAAYRKKFKK